MNNLQNLGFYNWLKDEVDLSKTPDLKIASVICGIEINFVEFNSN